MIDSPKVAELKKETSCFYTWMGNDGICRTQAKKGVEVVLEDARENSKIVNSLKPGAKFPILVDSRDIKSISKDARDYFSLHNRTSSVNAIGILVESPVSRIIGNFFIGINRSRVPNKLFTSEEDAVNWLKNFLKNG